VQLDTAVSVSVCVCVCVEPPCCDHKRNIEPIANPGNHNNLGAPFDCVLLNCRERYDS
jgi:hypothetical protein